MEAPGDGVLVPINASLSPQAPGGPRLPGSGEKRCLRPYTKHDGNGNENVTNQKV